MHLQVDRKPRRFTPMTKALLLAGEFEEPWVHLPRMAAGWMVRHVERERDTDLRSRTPGYHTDMVAQGWETLLRAVRYIAVQVECGQGARLRLATRRLGHEIGMSQSTAARCLARLRTMNLLTLHREHRIRRLTRHGHSRIIAKAAIHEVMTHLRDGPPEGDESRPLSRENRAVEHSPPERSEGAGG